MSRPLESEGRINSNTNRDERKRNLTPGKFLKASVLLALTVLASCFVMVSAAPLAHAQTLSLEKTWGGTITDYGYGVAVDGSGNIYVIGYTESAGEGGGDAVLLKFNASGGLLLQGLLLTVVLEFLVLIRFSMNLGVLKTFGQTR